MHARLTRVVLATALLGATTVLSPLLTSPAGAAPGGGPCLDCGGDTPPPVTAVEEAFRVRAAVNLLNNGGGEPGKPPPCSEEDIFGYSPKDGVPDHIGHMVYEPPSATEDQFRAIDGNEAAGSYWRLACVFLDGFDPGYAGISIDFFPEIDGPSLARLAVAEALVGVPAPDVRVNPTGDQLVNLPSWLWVEGIATTEFHAAPVSVPGITVTVLVSTNGVHWDMGDGTAFDCEGTGTPYAPGATPTCSHTYRRSSVSEPGQEYQGVASVRWTATYWINGDGPYSVDDAVVRATPFSLRVGESQAIVGG